MAGYNIAHIGAKAAVAFNAATTSYVPVGAGNYVNNITTEANSQIPYRILAGATASGLAVTVTANTNTGTTTVTLRNNTADVTNTLSISTLSTGLFEDTTHSDSVASGDVLSASITPAGAAGTVSVSGIRVKLLHLLNANVTEKFIARTSTAYSTASVDRFSVIAGILNAQSTESNCQTPVSLKANGTFTNLHFYVSSNGRSTTTTVTLRVNAADVNNTVSITSGATGLFEDTSNNDTVSDTDLLDYKITTGTGAGTLQGESAGIRLSTTTIAQYMHAIGHGGLGGVPANTVIYNALSGGLGTNTTESNFNVMQMGNTLRHYTVNANITANATTGSANIVALKTDSGAANVSLAFTTQTGQLTTTGDQWVGATNACYYEITNGDLTNTFTMTVITAGAVQNLYPDFLPLIGA